MVKSTELYKHFRTVLNPLLKNSGFSKMKGTQLGWSRPSSEGFILVWFQCDKWGFNNIWGSRFTINFQIVPKLEDAFTLKGRDSRIGYVLEGYPELDELRKINNEIIKRLPGTGYKKVNQEELPFEIKVHLTIDYSTDEEPAIYGRDIWFHYYSIDDLTMWSSYFNSKLLKFIEIFEKELKSKETIGRDRLNEMMSKVQKSNELNEKILIMKEFVSKEPDEYWRKAAEKYLNYAQAKINNNT